MTNSKSWDDGLSGPGLAIAQNTHLPFRVLAGPGTGKTFTLMRYVARLIQVEKVKPENILVSTFTRTAASDLTRSLKKLDAVAKSILATTLHSLAFSIIQKSEFLDAMSRVPRTLLDFEQRFLIEDLKNSFGSVDECKKLILLFEAAWASLQTQEPGWPTVEKEQKFQAALSDWLSWHKALMVGEVIVLCLKFLNGNALAPEHTRFSHVLVDEYQDLNKADQALLDLLGRNADVFAIGDDHQSIYSFRYANPDAIRDFHLYHANTRDQPLMQCRRCPRDVVELANSLIANNPNGSDRPLSPTLENPGGEVVNLQWANRSDEAEGIATIIERRLAGGLVSAGDVLILCPSRKIGFEIRDALNRRKVDAQSFFAEEVFEGSPSKIEKCPAQMAFTILSLLCDKYDRTSLRVWCGFGSNTLRSNSWKKLRSESEKLNREPFDLLNQLLNSEITISGTNNLIAPFRELLSRLSQLAGIRGEGLVDAIFPPENEWSEPFRQLAGWIEDENYDAPTLLQALKSGITQPEMPSDVAFVRIMSLHKSKGLTAKLVVVAGCVQGLIPRSFDPKKTTLTSSQYEQEQRRLFYVAVTRATETLILSSFVDADIQFKAVNSLSSALVGSKFLSECGPKMPRSISGSLFLDN